MWSAVLFMRMRVLSTHELLHTYMFSMSVVSLAMQHLYCSMYYVPVACNIKLSLSISLFYNSCLFFFF